MNVGADLVTFLLWCALANYVLLLLSFFSMTWLRAPIRRLHQRWFALDDAQIDGYMFVLFGFYKLAIWFFLLIPAIVFHFMGSQ